jgi:hypothetical protein
VHKARVASFAVLCVAGVALTVTFAWVSVARSRQGFRHESLPPAEHGLDIPLAAEPKAASGSTAVTTAESPPNHREPPASPPKPIFLVRHTGRDQSFGLLAVDPGPRAEGGRRATDLSCERVHFAAGHGVCLIAGRPLLSSYSAILFDSTFRSSRSIPVGGVPSRTRVSPNGRLAAITVFVEGHSYADANFSTETSIVFAESGQPLVANLEELRVLKDAQPFREADFNFWGVTFAADNRHFYATLGTKSTTYLVHGDVEAKTARVVREHVDCPSLSPDNTRLAFKKPYFVGNSPAWRLHVLDLSTSQETALAETRSVDDQVEWLDDANVLYGVADGTAAGSSDVWVVPADGRGRPEIFLKYAASPAVVRSVRPRERSR